VKAFLWKWSCPHEPDQILLVDDQPLFREGCARCFPCTLISKWLAKPANGAEAIRLARSLLPLVVLMDLQMPVLDGVAATRRLHEEQPDCRVIVLTTFDDDELVFDGLRAGAVGYLLKDAPSEKLAEAIRVAARGETFLQPSVAAKVVAEFARLSRKTVATANP
jgi:DNA-binding NarL/FixJ family response regulator